MEKGIVFSTIIGLTDVGLVRKNNEDQLLMIEPETGLLLDRSYMMVRPLQFFKLLLVVSDGMGGHEGGEVASSLTVDVIRSEISKLPKQLSPQSRLESAVEEANRVVWEERSNRAALSAMGATATAMLVERDMAYIAEVGDSRAYILRDGRLKQLTVDQTMLQLLIDSGTYTAEVAESSVHKNMLLQAIGSQEYLQIAVTSIQIQAEDIFLLCSDGLTGKVNTRDIKEIMQNSANLEAAANQLIATAKERGGDDNITVILAKFHGNGLETKVEAESLTKQIQVLTRFDPEQEGQAKPKIDLRPATLQDWQASAVIDAFVRTPEQFKALSSLSNFGDYIVLRKGDILITHEDNEEYFLLVSGCYRILVDLPSNERQTIGFIVSPTDQRTDNEIKKGPSLVRVKRQFFTTSVDKPEHRKRKNTIQCEDDENAVIRISPAIYKQFARILGERFVTAVHHS